MGNWFGKEVVRLYPVKKESNVTRSIRELKSFQKISLMPGEQKEIIFTLKGNNFAYYEEKINDCGSLLMCFTTAMIIT